MTFDYTTEEKCKQSIRTSIEIIIFESRKPNPNPNAIQVHAISVAYGYLMLGRIQSAPPADIVPGFNAAINRLDSLATEIGGIAIAQLQAKRGILQ